MSNPRVRKRTKALRAAQRIEMAELYHQGWTQSRIAAEFGLTQAQVSYDLKACFRDLVPTPRAAKKRLARILMELWLIKRECWEVWEKSKEDKVVHTRQVVTTEVAPDDAEDEKKPGKLLQKRIKVMERRETRCGNPAFMARIVKCMEMEAKLLGLYPDPNKLAQSGKKKQIENILVHESAEREETLQSEIQPSAQPAEPTAGQHTSPPMTPAESQARTPATPPTPPAVQCQDLAEVKDEDMHLYLHPGQKKAWDSEKRFVTVLAGTQSGKTTFGPHWLLREIMREGPGDYLVVAPTYPLLEKKVLPAFRNLFERTLVLGKYTNHSRKFTFSDFGKGYLFGDISAEDTVIHFCHASDAESLESATAKAAWLDEAGQKKFRQGSYEAIMRRLSIYEGRVLITTTPYSRNWLKEKLFDPWQAARKNHPEIDIIRFDSTENPAFPKEEFERMRSQLPLWKFNLFYRGIFTRPPGLIYDCFDPRRHKVPRFPIPETWPRFLGLDFGAVNMAGIYLAENPIDKTLFVYREYRPRDGVTRSVRQHVKALLAGEPKLPIAVGGSLSEHSWRDEFRAAGLPVQEPEIVESTAAAGSSSPVEVGISRVYSAISRGEVVFFEDLPELLDELESYSRSTDETGRVSDEIEDKSSYNGLDSLRYIVGHLRKPTDANWKMGLPPPGQGSLIANAPSGVFGQCGADYPFRRRVG